MENITKKAVKTAKKHQIGVPFVKGDPRINREGRPEGTFSLLTLLKQELQKVSEGQDKKTYADLIVKRMLKQAIEKGDQQQIKLIWNYLEGLPRQPVDVTSGGESLIRWKEKK